MIPVEWSRACKVSGISKVALPTKSMESGQQPFYFTGMFLLKLAGHVTKHSKKEWATLDSKPVNME